VAGDLTAELQESYYSTQLDQPHMLRKLTFQAKLEGGGGLVNFNSKFLMGQYLCKSESNTEGNDATKYLRKFLKEAEYG
jgi:hypothetical protein